MAKGGKKPKPGKTSPADWMRSGKPPGGFYRPGKDKIKLDCTPNSGPRCELTPLDVAVD